MTAVDVELTLVREPAGTVCQRCNRSVPHRAARTVLASGMCCLECLPEIVPGFRATG